MLASTTSEVVRLASRVVRRLDTGLAAYAARNAESSVRADHLRRLDEMRTLDDLYALAWLTPEADVAASEPAAAAAADLAVAAAG
jgi:hypothetical protein